MRLTGSRTYYRPTPPKMPPGLVELMEGLTREVLQHNPTDVYEFCAGHMQHLLEIRDGTPHSRKFTLDEKISKVQMKMRQISEKRMKDYDKNILLQQQQSQKETDGKLNNNSDNKEAGTSPENVVPSIVLQVPVHHEQELANSVEIEKLHEPCANESQKYISIQNESVTHDEIVISDEIKVNETNSMANESKNVEDIAINDNNINELICQPNQHNVNMNDDSDDILQQGNILNNGPGNHEESYISDNDKDKQSTSLEEKYSDSNSQEQMQKVEVRNNNIVNIDEKQIPETMLDKQCLQVQENYMGTPENIDSISNNVKIDVVSKNAMDVEKSQSPEHSNEKCMNNDTANSEIDTTKLSTADVEKHDSSSINEHKVAHPVIEMMEDNYAGSSKTENVHLSHDIDVKNSVKGDENDEQSKVSPNSNLVPAVEEKVEIKDINITQMERCENVKEDNIDIPVLRTGDAIKEIHPNEVKDKTIICDEGIPPIERPAVNEEKISFNITLSGDEEITVHSGLKQDNLNELHMKSSSVTNTETDDGNSNIENLGDDSHSATKNIVNEDFKNIAPHVNDENINNDGNVNLETAAITIQKVFRSFLFKSRASTFDDTGNDEENFLDEDDTDKKEVNEFPKPSTIPLERRPHGITRMDTVLQTVNEEKSLSLSTDDSSTLSSAATIIQAHVRGFLVRNKLNSNKTLSTNSFPASNSNDPSLTSLDNDIDQQKNKTVLNIHIVPDGGNFLSRDESLITSMDLSLDGSPPSSINLHPLGYNKSERRKQLKREDAIQSISPPSNNSGKLSEDSIKEILIDANSTAVEQQVEGGNKTHTDSEKTTEASENVFPKETANNETAVISPDNDTHHTNIETAIKEKRKSLTKMSSDEMDVVTPFISNGDNNASESKLMHSGEFHDLVLPTRVSRSDTTVVREFKSVLVYFLLWNPS